MDLFLIFLFFQDFIHFFDISITDHDRCKTSLVRKSRRELDHLPEVVQFFYVNKPAEQERKVSGLLLIISLLTLF